MAETPHYFIGFKVTQGIAQWLDQIQTDLKCLPYQTWMSPKDFHITLKFLGPVDETLLNTINDDLDQAALGSPFSLLIGSLGFFGSMTHPRVMWIGVSLCRELTAIHKNVGKIAQSYNFSREKRPFHPHITLAKKWTGSVIDHTKLEELQQRYAQNHIMTVRSLGLYRIDPGRTPKYRLESSYPLKGGTKDGTTR